MHVDCDACLLREKALGVDKRLCTSSLDACCHLLTIIEGESVASIDLCGSDGYARILNAKYTNLIETSPEAHACSLSCWEDELHRSTASGLDNHITRVGGSIWHALTSNVEVDETLVMVKLHHQVVYIALHKVLEAILLSHIHELLTHFILQDNRVTRGGLSADVVAARRGNLNIEVYEAASAPTEIVFGEIETSAIADKIFDFPLFNLVNSVIN